MSMMADCENEDCGDESNRQHQHDQMFSIIDGVAIFHKPQRR